MKRTIIFIATLLVLFTACEAFFTELTKTEPSNQKTIEIPKGWIIDKDSDYSKLNWNANFEISEYGNEISFIDSDNNPITIINGEQSLIFSVDNPTATFKENKIELKIKNLNLVFRKKTNGQII